MTILHRWKYPDRKVCDVVWSSVTGIWQIFGPNYPEISDSQLAIQNIIFEHLKEDITLIRKEKTNHGN